MSTLKIYEIDYFGKVFEVVATDRKSAIKKAKAEIGVSWRRMAGVKAKKIKKEETILKGQICWRCKRAAAPKDLQCSWAREFEPVEGWTAKKTVRAMDQSGKNIGYTISGCPLFLDEEKKC